MDTSHEAFNMLQLIANECYKTGAFYYSAKAFDVLERLEGDPEYWEGKRGACVGVFQVVSISSHPSIESSVRTFVIRDRSISDPLHKHNSDGDRGQRIQRKSCRRAWFPSQHKQSSS